METATLQDNSFAAVKSAAAAQMRSGLFTAKREQALAAFLRQGWPERSWEDWKYSRLPAAVAAVYQDNTTIREPALAARPVGSDAIHISISGGQVLRPRQLPAGIRLKLFSELSRDSSDPDRLLWERHFNKLSPWETNPLAALNSALCSDGLLLVLEPGAVIKEAIVVEQRLGPAAAAYSRVLLLAGPGSQAALLELVAGETGAFYNNCWELVLAAGSQVELARWIGATVRGSHFSSYAAELGADSLLRCGAFSAGGELVRSEMQPRLSAAGARVEICGGVIGSGSQQQELITRVQHQAPQGRSHQLIRGIYAEKSQGLFDGAIDVDPVAQKTDAFQSSQSIVLGGSAAAFTKPQLKIRADDVRCTHGATVGKLDRNALFYLRSRGFAEQAARALLLEVFLAEAVRPFKNPRLRQDLEENIFKKLSELPNG